MVVKFSRHFPSINQAVTKPLVSLTPLEPSIPLDYLCEYSCKIIARAISDLAETLFSFFFFENPESSGC